MIIAADEQSSSVSADSLLQCNQLHLTLIEDRTAASKYIGLASAIRRRCLGQPSVVHHCCRSAALKAVLHGSEERTH